MTTFQAKNARGRLSIDRSLPGYAYLGKYPMPRGVGTVSFTCVGTPLVFFSVPYNLPNGEGRTVEQTYSYTRPGTLVAGLNTSDGVHWTANTIFCDQFHLNNDPSGFAPYIRVFGRVDFNWPQGSGKVPRFQLWTDAPALSFDSGLRMLKLAGDTYGTELTLNQAAPGWQDANNKYDATFAMPFDMANKSIVAACRNTIGRPYNYNGYQDWDTGQWIDQYHMPYYDTLYSAVNNQLQVKRCITRSDPDFEYSGVYIVGGDALTTYSRLSVIDNANYP